MIDIRVLASGSAGNCYLINDGRTQLMLEAGIPFKQMQKASGFTIARCAACLITHEHKDHSKAVEDLIGLGIDCYMSEGTAKAIEVSEYKRVVDKQSFTVGTWKVMPFVTEHDAVEPLGYLLLSLYTNERVLFITDSCYVRYIFSDLNYMLIECNYADDILQQNIVDGLVDVNNAKRVVRSHMSLANCKELLLANDLSHVKEIYLCHLSDRNSDANRFKKEIEELTGKPVYIAG